MTMRPSPCLFLARWRMSSGITGPSSNGRTADFGSVNGGSNPPGPIALTFSSPVSCPSLTARLQSLSVSPDPTSSPAPPRRRHDFLHRRLIGTLIAPLLLGPETTAPPKGTEPRDPREPRPEEREAGGFRRRRRGRHQRQRHEDVITRVNGGPAVAEEVKVLWWPGTGEERCWPQHIRERPYTTRWRPRAEPIREVAINDLAEIDVPVGPAVPLPAYRPTRARRVRSPPRVSAPCSIAQDECDRPWPRRAGRRQRRIVTWPGAKAGSQEAERIALAIGLPRRSRRLRPRVQGASFPRVRCGPRR